MVMSATTSVEDKMSGHNGLEAGSLCQAPQPLLSEWKRKGKGGGGKEEEFNVALRPQRLYGHRDGEPRTSTSTFTQLLGCEENGKTNWRTSHKAMSLHQQSSGTV